MYAVWGTWILMSLTAWNPTHWVNECGATRRKCLQALWENSFIYLMCTLFLFGWWNLLSLVKDLCERSSCSLSRMSHPVWAPWLNLVQPGNGLLPNRCTDIFPPHSDRLAKPQCYSAQILNTRNTGADTISLEFFSRSHSHMKDLLDV